MDTLKKHFLFIMTSGAFYYFMKDVYKSLLSIDFLVKTEEGIIISVLNTYQNYFLVLVLVVIAAIAVSIIFWARGVIFPNYFAQMVLIVLVLTIILYGGSKPMSILALFAFTVILYVLSWWGIAFFRSRLSMD